VAAECAAAPPHDLCTWAMQPLSRPEAVEAEELAAGHLPVRHPGQRSFSGTPASAESMCMPHPAHVACTVAVRRLTHAHA